MAIALHHSRARGAAKLVLIGIANHDGDGGAWPAVATLARYAGVTPRNVQKALAELEKLGEIRRLVSAGGDHSTADHLRPNLYRFQLRCPQSCDHSSRHRVRGEAVALELLTGVSETTPPVAGDGGGVSAATPKPPTNHPDGEVKSSPSPIARANSNEAYSTAIDAKCPNSANGRHSFPDANWCVSGCGRRYDGALYDMRSGVQLVAPLVERFPATRKEAAS
jgi:hypothetical protein